MNQIKLPTPIIIKIFQHLPVSNLNKYELVSKKLHNLINQSVYPELAQRLGVNFDKDKDLPAAKVVKFYDVLKCHLPDSIFDLLKDRLIEFIHGKALFPYTLQLEKSYQFEGSINVKIKKGNVELIMSSKKLLLGCAGHSIVKFSKKKLIFLKKAITQSNKENPNFKSFYLYKSRRKKETRKIENCINTWKKNR